MRATLPVLMSLLELVACSKDRPPSDRAATTSSAAGSVTAGCDGGCGSAAEGSGVSAPAAQPVDAPPAPPPDEIAPAWRVRVARPGAVHLAILDRTRVALAREGSLDVEIAQPSGVRRAFRVATRGAIEGQGVVALVASPTEITAAANGAVRVFDAKGTRIRELLPEESKRAITALVTLRDGSVLASSIPDRAGDDTRVEVSRWATDGALLFTAALATGERWGFAGIRDASLSPDGAAIATGIDQVAVLDAATGAPSAPPFGFSRSGSDSTALIRAVRWTAEGPVAWSATSFIGDALATIHVVRRDQPVRSFRAHPGSLEHAAFVARDRVVTAGHTDRHVTVRDLDGTARCELTGVGGDVWAVATSLDGALVAAADDTQLYVWDLAGC